MFTLPVPNITFVKLDSRKEAKIKIFNWKYVHNIFTDAEGDNPCKNGGLTTFGMALCMDTVCKYELLGHVF